MKGLVAGAAGQLGRDMVLAAGNAGHDVVGFGRGEMDVADAVQRRVGLGWEAQIRFDEGIAKTVNWYRENEDWWRPIRSGEYRESYERQYGRTLG